MDGASLGCPLLTALYSPPSLTRRATTPWGVLRRGNFEQLRHGYKRWCGHVRVAENWYSSNRSFITSVTTMLKRPILILSQQSIALSWNLEPTAMCWSVLRMMIDEQPRRYIYKILRSNYHKLLIGIKQIRAILRSNRRRVNGNAMTTINSFALGYCTKIETSRSQTKNTTHDWFKREAKKPMKCKKKKWSTVFGWDQANEMGKKCRCPMTRLYHAGWWPSTALC